MTRFKVLFLLHILIISSTLLNFTYQQISGGRPFVKDPPIDDDNKPDTNQQNNDANKNSDTDNQTIDDNKNTSTKKDKPVDTETPNYNPNDSPSHQHHAPEPPNYYKPSPPPCQRGFVIRTFHAKTDHPQDMCVFHIKDCNQYSPLLGDCQECRLFFKRTIDEKVKALTRRGISICKMD